MKHELRQENRLSTNIHADASAAKIAMESFYTNKSILLESQISSKRIHSRTGAESIWFFINVPIASKYKCYIYPISTFFSQKRLLSISNFLFVYLFIN